MKVFISYSRSKKDRAIAGLLAQVLSDRGLETYYDERQTRGTSAPEHVGEDLREADAVIVLLTKSSER